MRKFSLYFIVVLTIFSLAIRLFRFQEPKHYYFDEVYHAVTAKAYADNNPDAYNPFAPAPKEGTAYDWLHPPLAKLVQAASIKIFGDNPLGWRLPSVIIGTAIIPATFVLSFILFGPIVAIFASATVAFENLTFVLSRITMNDVFVTFFILLSFIFLSLYLKSHKTKFLIFTAFGVGLSIGSKWTGAYAFLVIFTAVLISQVRERKISINILLLIILPLLMYIGAYGQFWVQGHTLRDFIDLHKQIWWYQNRHDLKHSYGTTPLYCVPDGLEGQKQWCPWVLDARGVYFSYEDYSDGKAGYIYALGNPLIFWAGIVSISYLVGKLIDDKKKKSNILLILSAYFVFWVPWIFSPRIMFLYHYLPAIPFLSISVGVGLSDIYKSRYKYLALFILSILIFAFFYFYPITSGLPIPVANIEKYMWLKSWR